MSKNKITFNFGDEKSLGAGIYALNAASPTIQNSIDEFLRQNGYGKTDTLIKYDQDKRVFTVEAVPHDKGTVVILEGSDLIFESYKSLTDKQIYAHLKEGRFNVYRFVDGDVDHMLGTAKNLESVKSEFESLPKFFEEQEALRKKTEEESSDSNATERDVNEAKMEVV